MQCRQLKKCAIRPYFGNVIVTQNFYRISHFLNITCVLFDCLFRFADDFQKLLGHSTPLDNRPNSVHNLSRCIALRCIQQNGFDH